MTPQDILLQKPLKSEFIQFHFLESSESAKTLIKAFDQVDIYSAVDSVKKTFQGNNLISLSALVDWTRSFSCSDSIVPVLIDLFAKFDPHDNMMVDCFEIFAGIMCFFAGSKSIKLSIAFSIFDEGGDGLLSRRAVWKIFRSFLRSLTLFVSFNISIEDIAIESTAKVFRYFNQPKYITLEDLSDWYLFSGQELSFWIELLDYKKWVTVRS